MYLIRNFDILCGRPGCVSFVKEWIDARQINEELKDELDNLYGGTVQS